MKLPYFFILVFIFFSCKRSETEGVFLGGEIINPRSDYLLLMQSDKVIDTLKLSDDNTFGKRLPSIKNGLYYFKHGYEYQYIYFDVNDSIRIRLNTWDFDETLVFEGKGAEKNELLLQLFLNNEKEQKIFYSYFNLSEKDFQGKIRDAERRQEKLLRSILVNDAKFSEEFIHLIKFVSELPFYRMKELYPYYHRKLSKDKTYITVSDSFYIFRESIDYDDPILKEYFAYQNYLTSYIFNKAYNKSNGEINTKSFFTNILSLVRDNIKDEKLKNNMLIKEMEYIFFRFPDSILQKHLNLFYENCTDENATKSFKKLISDNKKLENQKISKSYLIKSKEGDSIYVDQLVKNRNSVLFLNPDLMVQENYIRRRVNYLKQKFPSIQFIELHKDKLLCKGDNEYYIPNELEEKQRILSNDYPIALVVDKFGFVDGSLVLLTDPSIEKKLENLVE